MFYLFPLALFIFPSIFTSIGQAGKFRDMIAADAPFWAGKTDNITDVVPDSRSQSSLNENDGLGAFLIVNFTYQENTYTVAIIDNAGNNSVGPDNVAGYYTFSDGTSRDNVTVNEIRRDLTYIGRYWARIRHQTREQALQNHTATLMGLFAEENSDSLNLYNCRFDSSEVGRQLLSRASQWAFVLGVPAATGTVAGGIGILGQRLMPAIAAAGVTPSTTTVLGVVVGAWYGAMRANITVTSSNMYVFNTVLAWMRSFRRNNPPTIGDDDACPFEDIGRIGDAAESLRAVGGSLDEEEGGGQASTSQTGQLRSFDSLAIDPQLNSMM